MLLTHLPSPCSLLCLDILLIQLFFFLLLEVYSENTVSLSGPHCVTDLPGHSESQRQLHEGVLHLPAGRTAASLVVSVEF